MAEIENYKLMFDENLARVQSLCNIYNQLKTEKIKEEKNKFTDILRSAVVLLHSSFEEYYRNVVVYMLSKEPTTENLDKISFLSSEGKRKDKITLLELLQYRDKTVDELINKSIQETLNFRSFNNYNEIIAWSNQIKINLNQFDKQEKMSRMIERRHQIVHKADKIESNGTIKLAPIDERRVKEWIDVVCKLVELINKEVSKEENNKKLNSY